MIVIDKDTEEFFKNQGYSCIRLMPNGQIYGVQKFLFTYGLMINLSFVGYERRYCYQREVAAATALVMWDGEGDPPGLWIKEKPSDRLGPGAE